MAFRGKTVCRIGIPRTHRECCLRFDDAAENRFDLARQNGVFRADAHLLHAVAIDLGTHMFGDDLIDYALVVEQLIEPARADRRAQSQLQLPIEIIERLRLFGVREYRVDHTIACRQVDAQRDPVASENILSTHFDIVHAEVDDLGTNVAMKPPMDMTARRERLDVFAIDIEQRDVMLGNFEGLHGV